MIIRQINSEKALSRNRRSRQKLLLVREILEYNRIYEIRICHQSDSWWSATLQVLLPPQYPDRVPPVFEIHSAWMSDADMFEASDLLYTIYREHQGQIIIYQWVEALRTFIDKKFNDQEPIDAKGSRSDVSLKYHGKPILFVRFYWEVIITKKDFGS